MCELMSDSHMTCVCACSGTLSSPEAAVSVSGWETVREDLPSTEEVRLHLTMHSHH